MGWTIDFKKDGFVWKEVWAPPTDIYEDEEEYIVVLEVPGVNIEKVRVSMFNGVLHIEGIRDTLSLLKKKNLNVHQVEILQGRFEKYVSFPEDVDVDSAVAKYEDGLLIVHLPKKKIEIEIEEE